MDHATLGIRVRRPMPRFRRVDYTRPLSPYELLTGERFHDHHTRTDFEADELLVEQGYPRGKHGPRAFGKVIERQFCVICGTEIAITPRSKKYCDRCNPMQPRLHHG